MDLVYIRIVSVFKHMIYLLGFLLFCFRQSFSFTIDDLETLEEIGSGTCGQVCKMKHKRTGDVMAVKVISPEQTISVKKMTSSEKQTVFIHVESNMNF